MTLEEDKLELGINVVRIDKWELLLGEWSMELSNIGLKHHGCCKDPPYKKIQYS